MRYYVPYVSTINMPVSAYDTTPVVVKNAGVTHFGHVTPYC